MSTAPPVLGGSVTGWLACTFDDLTLLIPTDDAGTQSDADRLAAAVQGPELGMFLWQGELWPAYRLDRELRPVVWEMGSTTVVQPVCANGQARGIVCDQIRRFDRPEAVNLHPVPGCLRGRPSPVIALGLYETLRVGLVVRGDGMIRHLDAALKAVAP
jgi:hypothetical protein